MISVKAGMFLKAVDPSNQGKNPAVATVTSTPGRWSSTRPF